VLLRRIWQLCCSKQASKQSMRQTGCVQAGRQRQCITKTSVLAGRAPESGDCVKAY
jgi:hypothetical protein